MAEFLEKTLPNDLDTERLVLGYILLNGTIDFDVKEEDFYLEAHRIVLRNCKDLFSKGISPDTITVISKLKSNDEIEACGGYAYVASLTDGVPAMKEGLAQQYLQILREKAALRFMIQIANSSMMRAYSNETFDDIYGDLVAGVDGAHNSLNPNRGPVDITAAIAEAVDEAEAISQATQQGIKHGLDIGLVELDKLIPAGLKKDEMMVIGGRPGQGKTSLILNILSHMAKQGKAVLFFSIEMSRLRIMLKLLSMESEIPLSRISTGYMNKEDWTRLARAAESMSKWKVWIDDSTGIQVSDIRSRLRRLKIPIDAIMLDYLQLLQVPKNMSRSNDTEKVSYNSMQLKFLNKNLNIPVIAAVQLNRSTEKRKGGKPQLGDLRQSGQIEQDCDIAVLIHREIEHGTMDMQQVADLIVAKQRNGPTGECQVAWQGQFSKFADLWMSAPPQTGEDDEPW